MQLTENFNSYEFNCNDGTPVPQKYDINMSKLALNLQVLRDEIGEPLRILSAYRYPEYNKKIGGAESSQHLLCKAADITCKSYTPAQLAEIIERLIAKGVMRQGGIGIYPGFVHYDMRGVKARW